MLDLAIRVLFWVAFGFLAYVTLLPMTNSNEWWIRGWDFPRLHIMILCVLVAIPAAVWLRPEGPAMAFCCMAFAVYQGAKIAPYTQIWKEEIIFLALTDNSIDILVSNVLRENETPEKVLSHIRDTDADVLLLMETDHAWHEMLQPVLADYTTVRAKPMDNHYGMIFATTLEVEKAEFRYLSGDETPSIYAVLRDAGGNRFAFIGLHPRPPVPDEDTDERDEQIRNAAQMAKADGLPTVAAGDFNDVAWSHNSQKFKRYGGYRDPRIGRGFHASFDANSWLMLFPIDQFYVTDGIVVQSFERGPHIGSDHYPIHATFQVRPD